MCEPLSVGVHACRRADIGPETNVLVMGAGPIGLVTMLAARAFGAPRIVIVDVDDQRLSVAKELGANEAVKVSTNIQVSIFLVFGHYSSFQHYNKDQKERNCFSFMKIPPYASFSAHIKAFVYSLTSNCTLCVSP